jgi:hypothetical protein
MRNEDGTVKKDHFGRPIPLIELFEGSTYENKENLGADFIELLESSYTGQMRERFLMGGWASYEGLVYDSYDADVHMVPHNLVLDYLDVLINAGIRVEFIEGYDYGQSVQSCYILGFTDPFGNVLLLDGFHAVKSIGWQIDEIKRIRKQYRVNKDGDVLADPSIFRRGHGTKQGVGQTVSDIFWDTGLGITMIPADNSIIHGIAKVQSYMQFHPFHVNPFTGLTPAPFLYVSDNLQFVDEEITEYMWHKDSSGESEDKPVDRKDHAMDTIKYMFSYRPKVSEIKKLDMKERPIYMTQWMESDTPTDNRGARHGRPTH